MILDILYLVRQHENHKLPKVTEVKMKGRDEKENVVRLEMNKIEMPDKALDTEITIPQGYVRIK